MEKQQQQSVERNLTIVDNSISNLAQISEENKKIDSTEEQDFQFARETYLELLENSRESIQILMDLVKESESPRAFEVLSTLIRSTADITDKIIDLHKSNKQLKHLSNKNNTTGLEESNGVVNNNLFIGSTDELQKILKEAKKQVEEKIIK